jgi:hypothetical protein
MTPVNPVSALLAGTLRKVRKSGLTKINGSPISR